MGEVNGEGVGVVEFDPLVVGIWGAVAIPIDGACGGREELVDGDERRRCWRWCGR